MNQTSLKTSYELGTCSMLHDIDKGIQHSPLLQGTMKIGTQMKGGRSTQNYYGTNVVDAINTSIQKCFENTKGEMNIRRKR